MVPDTDGFRRLPLHHRHSGLFPPDFGAGGRELAQLQARLIAGVPGNNNEPPRPLKARLAAPRIRSCFSPLVAAVAVLSFGLLCYATGGFSHYHPPAPVAWEEGANRDFSAFTAVSFP